MFDIVLSFLQADMIDMIDTLSCELWLSLPGSPAIDMNAPLVGFPIGCNLRSKLQEATPYCSQSGYENLRLLGSAVGWWFTPSRSIIWASTSSTSFFWAWNINKSMKPSQTPGHLQIRSEIAFKVYFWCNTFVSLFWSLPLCRWCHPSPGHGSIDEAIHHPGQKCPVNSVTTSRWAKTSRTAKEMFDAARIPPTFC